MSCEELLESHAYIVKQSPYAGFECLKSTRVFPAWSLRGVAVVAVADDSI
jgi:hypothetical protein